MVKKASYCDGYLKREIDRWGSEGLEPFSNLELSGKTKIIDDNDEDEDEDNESGSTLIIKGNAHDLIALLRLIALGQQAKNLLAFGPMLFPYPEI